MPTHQDTFKVHAEWMRACGKGDAPRAYRVLKIEERGDLTFVTLDAGGHPWVVLAGIDGNFAP